MRRRWYQICESTRQKHIETIRHLEAKGTLTQKEKSRLSKSKKMLQQHNKFLKRKATGEDMRQLKMDYLKAKGD